MAAVPLGAVTGGAVADTFGLRAPLWLAAGALTVLAVAYAVLTRTGPGQEPSAEQGKVAERQ
ncbi:hypothetical protein [Streptomyces sp. Root369]|uniref:hypothetical protein n=1 Tax=Streptomyces sp. Root369 TaxID=1736523 RepID=UPI00070902DE|nr:hypothetical protein [Streptomyces sp. Root369]KQV94230.1 hypothetical protein ASD08_14470 [Streptomyces sp. Root369]